MIRKATMSRRAALRALGTVPWLAGGIAPGWSPASVPAEALPRLNRRAVGRAAVSSDSYEASQVGLDVLREGGTAVDAAVAVALALAVTLPEAGNIGGGGFMMVWPRGARRPVCVEYRETAPAAAHREMFRHDTQTHGHKYVGVPGTLRGLELAHRHFGRLPWRRLVEPAVALARDGFPVGPRLARGLNELLATSEAFPELRRVFAPPQDTAWQIGDRLVQPDLAETLSRVAAEGPATLYRGEVARQLVAEMKAGGGLISHEDLQNYRARLRAAVGGTYRGHAVYGPPPPSSGGTCLVQMLNMLETFPLRYTGRWSAQTVHWMAEVMRRAYADRARYLGDPDFTAIPPFLTSKRYARDRAADIDPRRATPSQQVAPELDLADESPSTTHFSVIDAHGNAVSNTYTLEHAYGSRVVVRGAGFLLNNEMTDFNWRPGITDRSGRIGTEPNVVAPGKRMLSSQTPTIVGCGGRPLLLTGTPGGRSIINTVLNIVLSVVEFRMPLLTAIDQPRFHHGWFPDTLVMERSEDPRFEELVEALRQRGHEVVFSKRLHGAANSIRIHRGCVEAVADFRRDAHAGA